MICERCDLGGVVRFVRQDRNKPAMSDASVFKITIILLYVMFLSYSAQPGSTCIMKKKNVWCWAELYKQNTGVNITMCCEHDGSRH
ncbi:unnamed protein product [Timema podura]|uniref:Plethodontid modulating factor n=1 Tax=Timema podura TaxID=61482 RepID=A0ABN7NS55_TIMPD|nr:unnamed protein product [Timema podura]